MLDDREHYAMRQLQYEFESEHEALAEAYNSDLDLLQSAWNAHRQQQPKWGEWLSQRSNQFFWALCGSLYPTSQIFVCISDHSVSSVVTFRVVLYLSLTLLASSSGLGHCYTMNQNVMTLEDAKASLRIMTENQTELLKMCKADRDELQWTRRDLESLRNEQLVSLTRISETEREMSRLVEQKQKAEAERDAVVKESRMALAQSEEARNKLYTELHQVQQQFQTAMERHAKSRKEMEGEMVQLLQQLEAERRKVLQMNMEKSHQDVAFMTLQQRFSALERLVTQQPTDPNHQKQPSR